MKPQDSLKTKSTGFLSFLTILLSLVFLVFSIRGLTGNPEVRDLLKDEWRESGPFELSPERGRFALLYSIMEEGTVHFPVDLARFVVPDLGYINGNYVSLFAPGVSYLAIPGYLIGKALNMSQVGVFFIISLFALFNSILVKKVSEKLGAGNIASSIAGMMFLFATPAFAYGVNLYQHHISTFLILLAIYSLISSRSFWSMALIWFLCAMSIPVDYPNLFLMLPIGIAASLRFFEVKKIRTKLNIKIKLLPVLSTLSVVLPLAFFLWFNQASYGNPLQFSGTVGSVLNIDANGNPSASDNPLAIESEQLVDPESQDKSALNFFKSRAMLNGLYIHLFSSERGIIYFTPILILSIFGAVYLYRKQSQYFPVLLGIAGMNLMLYSMWGDPWGGWAFGSRYLIPTYSVLSIFMAFSLSAYSKKFWFLIPFTILILYSVGVNTLGAITTSRIPPKGEAQFLETFTKKYERYSFDRSYEFLKSGKSKSLIYNTWANTFVSAEEYFWILSSTIGITILLLYSGLVLRKNEN